MNKAYALLCILSATTAFGADPVFKTEFTAQMPAGDHVLTADVAAEAFYRAEGYDGVRSGVTPITTDAEHQCAGRQLDELVRALRSPQTREAFRRLPIDRLNIRVRSNTAKPTSLCDSYRCYSLDEKHPVSVADIPVMMRVLPDEQKPIDPILELDPVLSKENGCVVMPAYRIAREFEQKLTTYRWVGNATAPMTSANLDRVNGILRVMNGDVHDRDLASSALEDDGSASKVVANPQPQPQPRRGGANAQAGGSSVR